MELEILPVSLKIILAIYKTHWKRLPISFGVKYDEIMKQRS